MHAQAMVVLFPAQALDEQVLRLAQQTPASLVNVFWVLTVIGGGWGLLVVVPFVARKSSRSVALWLLASQTVVSALVSTIKWAVGRVRPCDALSWCPVTRIPSPGGGSFPSGHAAGSFAFAAFVSTLFPRAAPAAFALAASIAWSRCVLAVHYPTDIVAGAILGTLVGYLFARSATVPAREKTISRDQAF